MKYFYLLLFTKALVCSAAYPECEQYRGEKCIVLHNHSPGICKPIVDCRIAVALLHLNNTRPTICSFEGPDSIVCCPLNNGMPTETTPTPQPISKHPLFVPIPGPKPTPKPVLKPPMFVPIPGPKPTPKPMMKPPLFVPIPGPKATPKPIPISAPHTSPPPGIRNSNDRLAERKSLMKCKEYKVCEPYLILQAVAGVNTRIDEFPHMTAIGWPKFDGGYAWNCGGSLISENYVLTAAHCTEIYRDSSLTSIQPTVARLGDWNINSEEDKVKVQDIPIVSITIHPEYAPPSKYHDIALLKLAHPATFTSGVRPACLWQSTTFSQNSASATGWGTLGYMEATSDILQKVVLQIANKSECQSSYNNVRGLGKGIVDEQLCAVDRYGAQDTCQGDSGGPLQIPDQEYSCSYHVIGVTSFGIGCGVQSVPGVYTRVSSYLDWIEDIVWPN